MKKLFLTLAFAAVVATGAFADDNGKKGGNTSSVSYAVLNEFNGEFSDAKDVTWTVTANSQKADFTLNGVKMTAFYSLDGEYLGITQNVSYDLLPASAQKEIAAKYHYYNVAEIIKFETPASSSSALDRLAVGDQPEPVSYFVDLKNDSAEILVRVSPQGGVYFFKQVK